MAQKKEGQLLTVYPNTYLLDSDLSGGKHHQFYHLNNRESWLLECDPLAMEK